MTLAARSQSLVWPGNGSIVQAMAIRNERRSQATVVARAVQML